MKIQCQYQDISEVSCVIRSVEKSEKIKINSHSNVALQKSMQTPGGGSRETIAQVWSHVPQCDCMEFSRSI